MLNISPEDLVDCTHEVMSSYRIGVRVQAELLASVCNRAGADLNTLSISRSTVHCKRFQKIETLGSHIMEETKNTLRGKKPIVHFDGKQVKQMEEEHNITVNVERIAVSVTSPDLEQSADILLGVLQTESSKGVDQAEGILSLLEYEIVDQVIGVCCDTTASNTGSNSGAIVYLAELVDKPLLWFLCRRHILGVHISHFMEALTGEKTKGPRRPLYVQLQKNWPTFKVEIDKMENIVKFDWKTLQVGSPLYSLAFEALEFGQRALSINTFVRGDYKNLCQLMVFYLGGNVPGFTFHQPGACHEARFMADALYILTLTMTDKIVNMMNAEERDIFSKAAFFISICYAPWFLKSYLSDKSTANDLEAYKSAHEIAIEYPKLGGALVKSMENHAWYLTEQLVVIALADDDVEETDKREMLKKLLDIEKPSSYTRRKPNLPKLSKSTKLSDLIGPESWQIFDLIDVSKTDLAKWVENLNHPGPTYEHFTIFVKQLMVVNDCSERNVRLIQDYVNSYRSEDMKQNVMQVARSNKEKLDRNRTKKVLKKM